MMRKTLLGIVATAWLLEAQPSPVIRPYLEVNGKEVQASAVRMVVTGSEIKATFRAPQDGVYSFGVSISSPEMAPLTPGMKERTCASSDQDVVLHYPYDWTSRDLRGNIMSSRPRLIMPGLKAGGRVYLADTHELFSMRLEPCKDGAVRALFLAHRFYNNGGDRATPELHLRAGESREFIARIYPSVEAVNRERFGIHDHPMRGNMVGVFFLESSEDTGRENDGFFGVSGKGGCCRSFTPEEWDLTAKKLQGTFRYAIVRDRISNSIPPIFHKRGEQVYDYQYLGAWRRHSPDVTPEIERDFALRDVSGQLYMAPRSPDGVFLLVDIRRPEVRARLVEDARSAVRAGYDGVFLDGWPFWSDATGDVGGNAPSATHSFAYARWQLLKETKEGIRSENPQATLGILTNHYYDSLGFADWGMKEFMYGSWYNFQRPSGNDAVGHYLPAKGCQIRQDKDIAYEEQEAPYEPGPIAFGAKGFSSIAVQSMLHFIRHPSGLYYTDAGQFPAVDLDKYLDTVVSIFKPNDLYVTNIDPPSNPIRFEGADIIQSERPATINFSRAVCETPLPNGKSARVEKLALEPGIRYKLSAECSNSNISTQQSGKQ